MIDFKTYNDVGSNGYERSFFKKISDSIKEPAFIGSLNGSLSGIIAATLATYGYISLPGFGPIIAMGTSVALSIGMIIGTIIGSITGIFIAILFICIEKLYTSL